MFYDRLKTLRMGHGESQKDLALILGVSPSAIGMWEQGRRTPDLVDLEKICDHYNVDMEYLLRGNQSKYASQAPMVPELAEVVDRLTPAQQRQLASVALVMFGGTKNA